ncbi:hypothetical protein WME89_00505 [Sorangium sp. So ce321]|uniref:hypothetical protein n=1 Tax=Sorangium sp. So ce321 TaxID=3133300 RepID=UPI003F600E0C
MRGRTPSPRTEAARRLVAVVRPAANAVAAFEAPSTPAGALQSLHIHGHVADS